MKYLEILDYVQRVYGRPGLQGADKITLQPYYYTADDLIIAASGSNNTVINISANADFVMMKLTTAIYVGGVLNQNPNAKILLSDTGSNEQFSDRQVDIGSIAQNGFRELYLPYPKILSGRSALNAQVFNTQATDIYTAKIVLHGVLVRGLN
jgi:hypothetical protein